VFLVVGNVIWQNIFLLKKNLKNGYVDWCTLKLVAISDTHNLHSTLTLPDGDILIHAGDATNDGTEEEEINFLDWFNKQRHKYKICIGGNHDRFLEQLDNWPLFFKNYPEIIYLNNDIIGIGTLLIYGSPSRPRTIEQYIAQKKNRKSAFKVLDRFECFVWPAIPSNIDILITHIPPKGFHSIRQNEEDLGSEMLRSEIINRIKPKLHVFGHNHAAYGYTINDNGTIFANAALANDKRDKLPKPPLIFDI
jgi:Icc-related predicted phosphoesterase